MVLQVSLKNLYHREQHCIGIYFPYQEDVIAITKTIAGVKFSRTHRCWYLPEEENTFDLIVNLFRANHVWVDYSGFHKRIQQKEKQPPVPNPLTVARDQARKQVDALLKLKGYSENTVTVYNDQFKLFLDFFPDSQPEDLEGQEIEGYLLYLIEKRKLSKSTQNQAINAIKFYFEHVLKQERKVYYLERPFKEKKLPSVLSQEEVMAVIEAPDNLKHRLMLMLIYSAGLRRSELLNLKVQDIDIHRCAVRIRGGKGKKDRQSILAKSLTPMIMEYLESYKPVYWLFSGADGSRYSASSLQKVLKAAVKKCGIKRDVTLHTLRHSFATHLLESGTSTRYIQVLLGHESPKTTEIYAHVTRFGMDKLRSPLDQININRQLEDGGE
jgi:integrase/recombinase XerD